MPDAMCAVAFALALSCADPAPAPIATPAHRTVHHGLAGFWSNLRDEAAVLRFLITVGTRPFP